MGDALEFVFWLMRDVDDLSNVTLSNLIDQLDDKSSIDGVEPLAWFVKYEQVRTLNESSGNQQHSLLAKR